MAVRTANPGTGSRLATGGHGGVSRFRPLFRRNQSQVATVAQRQVPLGVTVEPGLPPVGGRRKFPPPDRPERRAVSPGNCPLV